MLQGYRSLYSLHKMKTFSQEMPKILKEDLILQIRNYKDHYVGEKNNQKVIRLMKDELDVIGRACPIESKTYSY